MAEAPPTILEMSKVYKAILDSTQEITRYLRYKSSKNFFSFFNKSNRMQIFIIFSIETQTALKNAFGK